MNDPKEAAKDLLNAAGNTIKAPLNVVKGIIDGDPAEGVDNAVDNISDAIDNVSDFFGDIFDF